MKIQRTIPPTAAMIGLTDLFHGMAGFLIGEKYLRELKEGLKRYFGVKHVFLVSSGKAALTIILKALQSLSPEKREVLIPAYTCYSVPAAIVKAGLKVSLCDMNPATFDFDHALLKEAINDKTLCIVPTHLFGIPADVERVKSMCRHKGIYVVEDAAQAMGGTSRGRKLGAIGNVGFFSLGRGKNITCGSGGIVVTDDDRIADAVMKEYVKLEHPGVWENGKALIQQLVMKIFMHPNLYWLPAGISSLRLGETIFYRDFVLSRLSGVKAGVLRTWRVRLMRANRIRREGGAAYRRELRMATGAGEAVPYLRFPVLARDREMRDSIYSRVKKYGVSLLYPAPINEIEEIREQFYDDIFPIAKDISERLFLMPTHALLTKKDRMAICRAVQNGGIMNVHRHFVSAGRQEV